MHVLAGRSAADLHNPPEPLAAVERILLRGGWRNDLVQVVIRLLDVTRPPRERSAASPACIGHADGGAAPASSLQASQKLVPSSVTDTLIREMSFGTAPAAPSGGLPEERGVSTAGR
jgi:hypothetical protein